MAEKVISEYEKSDIDDTPVTSSWSLAANSAPQPVRRQLAACRHDPLPGPGRDQVLVFHGP